MDVSEQRWYIGYTFSNCERKARDLLRRNGIEVFLPITTEKRKWSDRFKNVEMLLFPSYIFVKENLNNLHRINRDFGISHFISFGDKFAYVSQDDVQSIRIMLKEFPSKTVKEKANFSLGEAIVIAVGPFKGFKGVILKIANRAKLMVNIPSINQCISVELNETQVIQMSQI